MKQEQASILVIDDDRQTRTILSRCMEKYGYDVTSADGGRQALQCIESQSFDLVLLDLMMPGINGFDVLKTLRLSFSMPELPIIVVTAKQESADTVMAFKLGASDYVTKPVDFDILEVRIATHLALKRA